MYISIGGLILLPHPHLLTTVQQPNLIVAGAGGIEYQLNQIDVDGNLQEVEFVGSTVGILALFVSFIEDGWASVRMASF